MTYRAGAFALATGLSIAACSTGPVDPASTAQVTAQPAMPVAGKTTYRCADGSTVDAWYPTEGTAVILRNGRRIDMAVGVSASGVRYVGGGWQWWTKGMLDASLAPLRAGEDVASAAGLACATG